MANLVRSRSWGTVKPVLGSRIDAGHPLADGLILCVLANEGVPQGRNLVNGTPLTLNPGTGTLGFFQDTKYGGALVTKLGNAHYVVGVEGSTLILPTAAFTMVVAKNRLNSASDVTAHWGAGTTGTGRIDVYLPFFDGTVYFDFGGQSGANRVSVGGLAFNDDIWAFTAGRRGMSIWQNGVNRASSGSAVTRTTGTGNVTLGQATGIGGTNEAESRYALNYAWNRELTPDEIQWLHAEPYAFMQPPASRNLYVMCSGVPPAPTGNLVTTGELRLHARAP